MAAAVEGIDQGLLVGRSRVAVNQDGNPKVPAGHRRCPKNLGLNGFTLLRKTAETRQDRYSQNSGNDEE
jgi:hypothetical protein